MYENNYTAKYKNNAKCLALHCFVLLYVYNNISFHFI